MKDIRILVFSIKFIGINVKGRLCKFYISKMKMHMLLLD